MTKYCCPSCPDHPILDDNLKCIFCKGSYVWKKKEKEIKIHSVCGNEMTIQRGESPGRGYGWNYCEKCKQRVPLDKIKVISKSAYKKSKKTIKNLRLRN